MQVYISIPVGGDLYVRLRFLIEVNRYIYIYLSIYIDVYIYICVDI